jgi:hypothetical protein
MKTLLTALLAVAALACGASTAHAGALTLNASVQGAGQITAVSGGTFDCDHRGQELETDTGGCDTAFYNAVFAVSLTLKATAPSGWKRSGWEGCDDVDSKGQCVITGPVTSRGYKTVKAIFEDTQGPTVTWDLQRLNGDSTIDLAWHADEPATFRCGVMPSVYVDCTSPYHTSILSQNTYGWDVEATDRNGSKTVIGSQLFVNVQTVLTSAPSGRTSSRTASLVFGLEPGGTVDGFQCRLDGGAWNACTSPWIINDLGDGPHTAEVRGHRAGSYEIIPESATWTVDTVAPNTTLTGGPQGQVNTREAAFTLGTDESGKFQCSLDGGDWVTCGAAPVFRDLADGEHTLSARAVDEVGNADASPVSRTWTVDATPSVTKLTGPLDGSTVTDRTATFSFIAGDNARFECRLDGAAWAKCTSPWTLTDLAVGAHVAQIRSIDDAGNVEAPKQVAWTVAAKPPVDEKPVEDKPKPPTKPTTTGTSTTPAATASAAPAPAGGSAPSSRAVTTPAAPVLAKPVLSGARKGTAKVDRKGRFTVPGLKIACATACKVTATTTGGKGAATIAAGRSGTVKVTLGKKAERTGKVRVNVTVSGPGGTVTATVAVTLKK